MSYLPVLVLLIVPRSPLATLFLTKRANKAMEMGKVWAVASVFTALLETILYDVDAIHDCNEDVLGYPLPFSKPLCMNPA